MCKQRVAHFYFILNQSKDDFYFKYLKLKMYYILLQFQRLHKLFSILTRTTVFFFFFSLFCFLNCYKINWSFCGYLNEWICTNNAIVNKLFKHSIESVYTYCKYVCFYFFNIESNKIILNTRLFETIRNKYFSNYS